MRRRLTVTGASQNIDGVAKVGTQDSQEIKKPKKKDKVSETKEKFRIFSDHKFRVLITQLLNVFDHRVTSINLLPYDVL